MTDMKSSFETITRCLGYYSSLHTMFCKYLQFSQYFEKIYLFQVLYITIYNFRLKFMKNFNLLKSKLQY